MIEGLDESLSHLCEMFDKCRIAANLPADRQEIHAVAHQFFNSFTHRHRHPYYQILLAAQTVQEQVITREKRCKNRATLLGAKPFQLLSKPRVDRSRLLRRAETRLGRAGPVRRQ